MKYGLVIISKKPLTEEEIPDIVAPYLTSPDDDYITQNDRTAFYQNEYNQYKEKDQSFFEWLEETYPDFETISQGDDIPTEADGIIVTEDDDEVISVIENESISEIDSFEPFADPDFELKGEPKWQFKRSEWLGFKDSIDKIIDSYLPILKSGNFNGLNRTFEDRAKVQISQTTNREAFKKVFQQNFTPADAIIDLRIKKKDFRNYWHMLSTSEDDTVHPSMLYLDDVEDHFYFNVLLCTI